MEENLIRLCKDHCASLYADVRNDPWFQRELPKLDPIGKRLNDPRKLSRAMDGHFAGPDSKLFTFQMAGRRKPVQFIALFAERHWEDCTYIKSVRCFSPYRSRSVCGAFFLPLDDV